MPNAQSTIAESVADFLPGALSKALSSYQGFCDREYESEKPKAFKEHHESCKAAISHVELLLKLAERFDVLRTEDNGHEVLAAMIESARSEVGKYKEIND